jgi:glycosyltransferase involved in cell wall biosynthesis
VVGEHALLSEPLAEALADQVLVAIEWTKTERSRRIAAAREWAEKYSWAESAAATVSAYKAVVEQ